MNVERRIQIIVIAIRNDPLDPGTSVFDIPALKPLDRDSIPFASRYSASLSNEFLSTHLPSALQSEELMGPLDALVATREARGVVTREILQSALKINARPFYQMCRDRLEKAASNRRGISRSDLLEIGLSEKTADRVLDYMNRAFNDSQRFSVGIEACAMYRDTYRENFSLAQALDSDECKPLKSGSKRRIALGWALSRSVEDRMACLASKVHPPEPTSLSLPMLPLYPGP